MFCFVLQLNMLQCVRRSDLPKVENPKKTSAHKFITSTVTSNVWSQKDINRSATYIKNSILCL